MVVLVILDKNQLIMLINCSSTAATKFSFNQCELYLGGFSCLDPYIEKIHTFLWNYVPTSVSHTSHTFRTRWIQMPDKNNLTKTQNLVPKLKKQIKGQGFACCRIQFGRRLSNLATDHTNQNQRQRQTTTRAKEMC